eukprot:GHUV01033997.1.p2 GENE.GHUV01033997.1~~GHUV01033997.1.p2  ORF type:complete len:142 (-),score=17.50 GHUV01033997.1:318-743(-)
MTQPHLIMYLVSTHSHGPSEIMVQTVHILPPLQLHTSPKRLALQEAVSTPHWGNPAALRFSRSGGRFGAVGDGGLVGLWRQDFISAVDGLGHAEWVGHCLSRVGTGITFLGDTGSQVCWVGVLLESGWFESWQMCGQAVVQ